MACLSMDVAIHHPHSTPQGVGTAGRWVRHVRTCVLACPPFAHGIERDEDSSKSQLLACPSMRSGEAEIFMGSGACPRSLGGQVERRRHDGSGDPSPSPSIVKREARFPLGPDHRLCYPGLVRPPSMLFWGRPILQIFHLRVSQIFIPDACRVGYAPFRLR